MDDRKKTILTASGILTLAGLSYWIYSRLERKIDQISMDVALTDLSIGQDTSTLSYEIIVDNTLFATKIQELDIDIHIDGRKILTSQLRNIQIAAGINRIPAEAIISNSAAIQTLTDYMASQKVPPMIAQLRYKIMGFKSDKTILIN